MIDLNVPVLETEHLILRGRTLDDFPFFLEMWRSPDVTKYIGGEPLSEEDTWTKYLRMLGHWAVMEYGYWAVVEKQSGSLVGEVGFGDFKREIKPSLKGEPEMGWVLAPAAHGKGYATEAAQAAIAWGDTHFNGGRMSCIIDPLNQGSIRVAEKCGFQISVQSKYHGEEVLVLHRAAPEA